MRRAHIGTGLPFGPLAALNDAFSENGTHLPPGVEFGERARRVSSVMGQTKERKEPTERCPAGETGAVEEETRKEWCRGVMSGGLFGRYAIDSRLRFMGGGLLGGFGGGDIEERTSLRINKKEVWPLQVAKHHATSMRACGR